ncbi:Crp/Fnr family transcriptional regulator [Rhizobium bangladeshense]|uniref:Crp/Fnr family transcriptional regulator n=1 Tax=Rhizobium bangladeshense TaxID=1138189 RepID=UPI001C82B735|nr:Crp/Fnr family transcriptional regulator [Rhizobium bangladeshense]MBX4894396.1 Crp/Fnr family transcriptional regulator [Rhizobium bangladeshense]MBX4900349.1 Crp/Fnr family transcriptional regulator [Rhizobium bangladeshense]MBX4912550.1 Crp/Fnr family transcriptional regulator [Rhizobium bangladeshense]MBY3594753.1 Crp/Fnr family transcriptional regulator [Rhizobium bangladeshense]MBY3611903.1 Crp/Fnr family transcriptional regulator [Rhizobium bangladeshense]
MIEALLLNLGSRDVLSGEEENLLRSILVKDRHFAAGEDLVPEGSRPPYSTLLLDGFAARYKVMADGSRQITALHVAGDFVDLHAFPVKKMDHGIVALSPCHVVLADHADLRAITERMPHLTRLLWLDTLVDGAIHREWIVAMGRRSKRAQIAHLVCELFMRLQVVRRTRGESFQFPLTQIEMADVLGISVVHLNKTLQALRREGVFTWENRTITIVDWERLQEIAEFDPVYLSISREPR